MNFPCPLPVSLTPVIPVDCPFRFDQIVKMLFFQRGHADFATLAAQKLLATYTPGLASPGDVTTIVATPIFSNLVIPGSAGKFVGGNDNTTFKGLPEYYGDQPVTVTGEFKNLPPATKTMLDDLTPFSFPSAVGLSDLKGVFINKDGIMFFKNLTGFDIYNYRIGSSESAGLYTPNLNKFSFDLAADWDKGLVAVQPSFDALTLLVNAGA